LWFFNDLGVRYFEFVNGEDYILRDAYPLDSVIQMLLVKIGSHLIFDNKISHSDFLYNATNPMGSFLYLDFDGGSLSTLSAGNIHLFITPKTNITKQGYTQAAQKGEISLRDCFEMLKNVFKVRWHVENPRVKAEHVSWYQKGGTYGTNVVGTDLSTLINLSNGKNWSFGQNKWKFDLEAMPERYEYSWMDKSSLPFAGYPIQINREFVQEGKIETMSASPFSSDVDFMAANSEDIAKDGFALLGAVLFEGEYRLPFIQFDTADNSLVIMQNGFLSWMYLHNRFHKYDLPSKWVTVNDQLTYASTNITRQKTQEVTYPGPFLIDPIKLIKTGLGTGQVETAAINMESKIIKAIIKHNTE